MIKIGIYNLEWVSMLTQGNLEESTNIVQLYISSRQSF